MSCELMQPSKQTTVRISRLHGIQDTLPEIRVEEVFQSQTQNSEPSACDDSIFGSRNEASLVASQLSKVQLKNRQSLQEPVLAKNKGMLFDRQGHVVHSHRIDLHYRSVARIKAKAGS